MKFTTFIKIESEVLECAEDSLIDEVLIETKQLARIGSLDVKEASSLAARAKAAGLRAVLVWDILMTEAAFSSALDALRQVDLAHFDALRVVDMGAAFYIKKNYPAMPVQLDMEGINHNLRALKALEDSFGETLERIILSTELPIDTVTEYCKHLKTECELSGAGPVQLSYTPRPLLSSAKESCTKDNSITGNEKYSELCADELGTSSLRVIENRHGTHVFAGADHYVLQHGNKLSESGAAYLRLDRRLLDEPPELKDLVKALVSGEILWPQKTKAYFFLANDTTAQFKRLKSPRLAARDKSCLAQAVAADSGRYTMFFSYRARDLDFEKSYRILLTTGEELIYDKLMFRDVNDKPLSSISADQLLVTDWLKRVTAGALLFEGRV